MKVVIDLSAGRLSLEGDGPDLLKVLEAARSLAPEIRHIQIVTSRDEAPTPPPSVENSNHLSTPAPTQSGTRATLRQFARSLSLSNAAEKIASVAYYVNKIEGRPSFSNKEMDGWFTMCGFQKPSQMALAIFDTKRKYGYVDNVSRGNWRISNQGENRILALIEQGQEQRA